MKMPSGTEGSSLAHLPDRLRRARRLASISQASLAQAVGISPSAVAQWEQIDGTLPGLAHLVAVARVTGVSVDWLATGAGRPRYAVATEEHAALVADAYARDAAEEGLLRAFRLMGPRARRLMVELIEDLGHDRARARRR
jgi:transcriptional regulator with XRE-family HTH domain